MGLGTVTKGTVLKALGGNVAFLSQEQELKLAADAVLCEVRKKQVDVKRMQDVLRSLEKLRRLRKEAAWRKGDSYCCTQPSTFSQSHDMRMCEF